MLYSSVYTFILATLSSFVVGHPETRATSCLTCGGCAFQLRASGSGVSYIDGAYVSVSNYAGGQPYNFAAFASGSGTQFKLDTSCRLVVQPSNATAQVFSGTANKNRALYFQKGTAAVGGNKPVEAICSISTASATLNQLTCPKAGSDTGLTFYTSRGTVEAGQYEIGQDLLVLWKSSDKGTTYTSVTLTAVQV